MKRLRIIVTFIALISLASENVGAPRWTLTWSDEFDGPANSIPDRSKWIYDIGGGGWGNNELEYYTSRSQNAYLDGKGHLIIKAIKETYTGAEGVTRNYTSARLLTKGKFDQKYGRFEARIRLPAGRGIWPAFWMLGKDIDGVGWPNCGEIDIMENIGKEPSINHGSLHGPGYSGGDSLSRIYTLPGKKRFSGAFHTFAIEWEANEVRFYVDGVLYHTKAPADLPAGKRWVFDHPFFILLNVAVGGSFPGSPDQTISWPQMMVVDYVRAYSDASVKNSTDHR
jgi:beta-glucanase (GH16 family)